MTSISLKYLPATILVLLGLARPAPAATIALDCLAAKAIPSTLPAKLEVGVETIHRDPDKIITIYVPMAPSLTPSRMLDTNSKKPSERLPDIFAISDGTVKTPFVGVDRRAGSRLSRCIDEIAALVPRRSPQAAYVYLRDHLQTDFLREPPKAHRFAWDRAPGAADPAELTKLFSAAKDLPVGHYPLRSKQTQSVVALEEYLRTGYGTCLHKALLAALVLEKLKLPHRLVNGAMRSGGHTWIELADGRVLDPSLSKLVPAAGGAYIFENQLWPYLALP